MTRTDRNRLLKLCMLAAPLLFAACTERASAPPGSATAESAPVRVPDLPEVVVTASRIDSDEDATEEERRIVARSDR